MRIVESIQRAENGGFPCENGTFEHGEPVVILSKRELAAFAIAVPKTGVKEIDRELDKLRELANSFVSPPTQNALREFAIQHIYAPGTK